MITSEQRELMRNAILGILDANGSKYGVGLGAIAIFLRPLGFRVSADELRPEVQYLEDKGFVLPISKLVSPENRVWRITAEGRDYCAIQ